MDLKTLKARLALRKARLAGKFVTWYYNRMYDKAVRDADAKHEEDGKAWYVVDHPFKEHRLAVMDRKAFRGLKHFAQSNGMGKVFWSHEYNMAALKESCWYHTADGSGKNTMDPKKKEFQRLVFIGVGLERAGLRF